MPHPRTRRTRWPLAVIRALFALAALAALLAGVPALLLSFGQLPTSVPSLSGVQDALMAPDDGTLLMTTLTIAAWVAWLWLTIPVLAETAAVVVRRTSPRLPGMGTGQRLAAYLLGSILLASPAAAASAAPAIAATAPQAHALSTAHPQTPHQADPGRAAADATPAASVTSREAVPTVTVGDDGATMWELAEQYLGDGMRYKDIARDNPHLANSTAVPAGTVVQLPADARTRTTTNAVQASSPSAPVAPASAPGTRESSPSRHYTVESGDDLSQIAKDQLGDAGRWPQIYQLNKGEQQPGGRHFTNPDLIYPGQKIDLPTATTTPSTPPADTPAPSERSADTEHDSTQPSPPAPSHHAGPTGQENSGGGSETAASPTPRESLTPPPSPHETKPTAPSTAATPGPQSSPPARTARPTAPAPAASTAGHQEQEADQSEGPGRVMAIGALAVSGLLAGALLSMVATRRVLQQRRRRRGNRIAQPQGEVARTEQELRVAESVLDTSLLDVALRTAAAHLADTGRHLPPLAAAVIGPDEIVLHLARPTAPVAPFAAAPDSLFRWTCPATTHELLPAEDADNVEPPYPALVSLGWDPDGRLVLVDLEHLGHLHLTGPDRDTVLRTIALELATSEFTHHIDVTTVGGVAPGLDGEVPERVTDAPGTAEALRAARAHHQEQQRALTTLGSVGVREARTNADTASAWTAHLLLTDDWEASEEADLRDAAALLDEQPRTATALITAGTTSPVQESAGWELHADLSAGPVRLPIPDLNLTCELQALTDEQYAHALDILATTREPDVPAQRWEAAPQIPVQDPTAGAQTVEEDTSSTGDTYTDSVAVPAGAASQVPSLLAQFASYGDQNDDTTTAGLPADPALHGTAMNPDAGDGDVRMTKDSGASGVVAARHTAASITVPVSLAPDAGDPDVTDEVAADSSDEGSQGPVIRVLGPVDVFGARGTTESKRVRVSTELAAWLILHPGLDHHALDEALWPGREVSRKNRNATVSRLRTWLGTNNDGDSYLPAIATTTGARYALADDVTSDWHQFQQLVHTGTQGSGPAANDALRTALRMVRGRPFSSVDRRRYIWAEHLAQDMISAIVDAAHELAERCLATRDPRGALWAATKGLDAAPEMESLYRILFQAYAAVGDRDSLERAAAKLDALNEELGCDCEEDTALLLHDLLSPA
ncbi:LysM peptidoglycan-binding domain-containing protein [Streptomyces sp. NPDC006649]|uniref:LysM peptidoglycan-binding domain-containing protein n=1 Tax=Streptomyces sp. NPDC006649 TaxID=3156896 RepID=UPI0033AA8689